MLIFATFSDITLIPLHFIMSQEFYQSDASMEGMYEENGDTVMEEIEPNIREGQDNWQELVALVYGRMTRSMLTTADNTEPVLMKVIAQGDLVGAQRIAQLLTFAQDSAHMNDEDMATSLGCIPADEDKAFVGTRYYVRSAQLMAAALRQVAIVYEARYADPYLVQAINNNILAGVPDEQMVFLRYIGCTTASLPTEREHTDSNAVLQTRLGNFMQAAQAANHPLKFSVYEVPSLRLPCEHTLLDTHEQVLLHIFDRSVCLNSQPGGFYRSYQPSNEDNELLMRVLAKGLEQLQHVFFGPVQAQDTVRKTEMEFLFYELYKKRLPTIDVQRAGMIGDEHIRLFGTQAAPGQSQATNSTPLLIFARDITREDGALVRGFFDGSRAGQLTRDLIASCLGSYQVRDNFAPPPSFNLFNCQPFERNEQANRDPFEEAAAAVVRRANPFVVSTLGFDPHATAFSNYRGR